MGDTTSNLRENPEGQTEILVGRAKGGCQDAWNILYVRYRKMLVAHVQARIPGFARRRFDAEDVLQTAITRAWQNIGSFVYQGEGSFRRWLATLVVNTCQNEIKAQRSAALQRGASEEALAALEDREALAQNELDQTRMAMLEAMGQIDDEDRDILIQRLIEDLSFEAIAEIQGCSRERAREQYATALGRLERRMRA